MAWAGRRTWGAALAAPVLVASGLALAGETRPTELTPQPRGLGDGVYTEEQASRGRRVYGQACSSCHADNLQGGEMGPGLMGEPFIESWDGERLSELMLVVQFTMPQDNPGGLSPEDYQDVVAYLLQANDFPPGDTDLTPDSIEDVVIAPAQ